MRTAGWEAGCTLGAHEARQDQAAERKETFLCIHEYHSSRRDTRTKTSEVNGFSLSSSASLGLLQVQNTEGGKHILLSVWLVSENKFRSKPCVPKQQNQDVLCGCQRLFKHFLQLEISHFFLSSWHQFIATCPLVPNNSCCVQRVGRKNNSEITLLRKYNNKL